MLPIHAKAMFELYSRLAPLVSFGPVAVAETRASLPVAVVVASVAVVGSISKPAVRTTCTLSIGLFLQAYVRWAVWLEQTGRVV